MTCIVIKKKKKCGAGLCLRRSARMAYSDVPVVISLSLKRVDATNKNMDG